MGDINMQTLKPENTDKNISINKKVLVAVDLLADSERVPYIGHEGAFGKRVSPFRLLSGACCEN